jgi:hypothetical protein
VPPMKPMLPVRCSAANLPFGDASFAAAVASDVLEHVPPEQRIIVEALLQLADRDPNARCGGQKALGGGKATC